MSNFYLKKCNCVFIHIPKTGGLSIRKGMFECDYEGPFYGSIPPQYQDLFKFCFVRNPYDRMVSAWKYYKEFFKTFMSFKQFITISMDDTIDYHESRQIDSKSWLRHHSIPQTHPYNCLQMADFIGRFENINKDMGIICDHLNIKAQLPHINKTKRDKYQDYYDVETRRLVKEFYKKDLELLEYVF